MKRNVFLNQADIAEANETLGLNLPYSEDTSVLKESLTIGKHTIANRVSCQSMEGCDGEADGRPGALSYRRYERLAKGGAGLIWFEATACMQEGRANPRQLMLDADNLDAFKRAVEFIKETGMRENGYEPVVILQATHSGRYSRPEKDAAPVIALHHPILEQNGRLPDSCIVTDEHLDEIRDRLVQEAVLGEKAGFDGVDIKACHRYLTNELLAAYEREGRYGGTFENRTRLLREAVQGAVESCSSDYLVTSRLNLFDGYPYPYGFGVKKEKDPAFRAVPASELQAPAFDPEEPILLVKQLYAQGVRLMNLTMGNPYFNPHVTRPYTAGGYPAPEHPLSGVNRMLSGIETVKRAVPEMKVLSSGMTFLGTAAPHVAAAYVARGGFDLAGFGRTILAYPDFAKDIVETGEMSRDKICVACSKCTQIMRCPGGTPGCVVRDRALYGPIYDRLVKQ